VFISVQEYDHYSILINAHDFFYYLPHLPGRKDVPVPTEKRRRTEVSEIAIPHRQDGRRIGAEADRKKGDH
jgi:hypothetical protein